MEAGNIIFAVMHIGIGLLLMAIAIPLHNRKVAMNYVIGVRLKKSFTSEKNWYLMNAYGGRQLLIWSAVLVVLGFAVLFFPFNGQELFMIIFAFTPVIVLIVPTLLIVRHSKTLSD